MTAPRLLRVRCARWEQVDAFLRKKLRADGRLSMKVPFAAEAGAPVTLAIELPNQLVVSLDGVVGAPSDRDRPDAAVVVLTGARAAIERLGAMLAAARASGGDGDVGAALTAREAELVRLRQQAAHEVLGCSRGPTPEELRTAWRQRVRREHPDTIARFRSAALRAAAEEAMVHVTRAYERVRATVCADHRAVIAGTSVRTIGSLAIEAAGDGFDVVPLTPPVADAAEPVTGHGRRIPAPTGAPPRAASPTVPSPTVPSPTAPPPARITRERVATTPPPARAHAPTAPAPVRPVTPSSPPPSTPLGLELDLPSVPLGAQRTVTPPRAAAPASTTATVEQSLRQARSGPGDRFVRAIRERLVDADAAGAAQLATAAAQVYPRDRRLSALVEIASAQAACTRHDRPAAIASVRAALLLDPDGDEARRVLAALEQGAALAPALIGDAYR